MRTPLILLALSACAGTYEGRPKQVAPPPRSAEPQRVVVTETPLKERFNCGDTVLNDNLTTGGLRVTNWTPCFDVAEEQAQHERWVARHQHPAAPGAAGVVPGTAPEPAAARHDRQSAAQLAAAEGTACNGIPAREREHSVFAHRKEIASVEPVRENDEVHGVRIVFKPVRGMSAEFVRKDIACTRARWDSLGRDPDAMPYDPTLVEGADVQVIDRGNHTEVVVLTGSKDAAAVAMDRAQGALTAEK